MPSVVKIPKELAHELDRLAGAEHKPRTTYVVDILWRHVRRNKQREALKLSAGAWNPADHPEQAKGGAAYIDQIRSEPDQRFEDAIRPRSPDGNRPSRHVHYSRSPQPEAWPHRIPGPAH